MTRDEALERVEAIRAVAHDDEQAHGMEDSLRGDVLAAIVLGECDDPALLAAAALQTDDIEFARWCA